LSNLLKTTVTGPSLQHRVATELGLEFNHGSFRFKLYTRGGQPVKDQEPHFFLCYTKEPHSTHEHHPISSSLTHIPMFNKIYCKYITHQHDHDRTSQCIYCYGCYLVGLLVLVVT